MQTDGGADPRTCSRKCIERRRCRSVPAHDVRRSDAPLRLGQAGPAHPARARRRRRSGRRTASSRCSPVPRRIRRAASRRCACRAAARCRARRSTTTRAFVARYGAKGLAYIKVNETAKGREGLQSPIVKFLSDAAVDGHPRAHRRAGRRPHLLRRRQREGRQRRLGALRLKVGQDLKLVASRLAAAVGRRLPDVRVGRGGEALGRDASSVHRAA